MAGSCDPLDLTDRTKGNVMADTWAIRNVYTPEERRADAAVHVVGLVLGLMSVPAIILMATLLDGRLSVVLSMTLYGAALLAMLGASAAYHMIRSEPWEETLRRVDHAAIYVKIAATQTPFAVMTGSSQAGWLLAAVWAAALAGAMGKLLAPRLMTRIGLPLYLLLGWSGLMLLWPGEGARPLFGATLILAMTGGVLYTIGVYFFLAERLRFHNAIWHGFVLVASLTFYAALTTELGLRAAAGTP